jgi:hypothetical protein
MQTTLLIDDCGERGVQSFLNRSRFYPSGLERSLQNTTGYIRKNPIKISHS